MVQMEYYGDTAAIYYNRAKQVFLIKCLSSSIEMFQGIIWFPQFTSVNLDREILEINKMDHNIVVRKLAISC